MRTSKRHSYKSEQLPSNSKYPLCQTSRLIDLCWICRLVIMDACSSSDLDGGGIATPSRSSAVGYAFVPTFHLMTDVDDSHSGTSLSVHSSPVIRASPAVMGYSFVPPFQLIQEVDSKPNTCDNSTKPTSPKNSSNLLMEKTFYKNISNTLPIQIK